MKYIGIAATVVLIIAFIGTPAHAKKAGEVKDSIYYDNDYHYSMEIPNGWSTNIKNAKYALRMTMEQKSPVPPYQFQGNLRDYMQIPTMAVIVDTTSLGAAEFVDSLLSPDFESDQKKFMYKYLKIISRPYELVKRKEVTFQGQLAVLMEARQAYEITVASGRSDRADVINDNKYGTIFVTVRGGHVYVISMICEYRTSQPILDMYNAMISSLKFGQEEGTAEESQKKG
jgi:hypothetical protein